MTVKKRQFNWGIFGKIMGYIGAGFLIVGLVALGSFEKSTSNSSLNISAFAEDDFQISVDQLTELYVVADVSDALSLASAADVASNYTITTSMYNMGQTASTGKIEKPIVSIETNRGVVAYTVQEGDTMDSIASAYGLTTDQIRWSNGLKTTAISVGDTLYLPSRSGIVYTVKSSDSLESIAEKYGSNTEEITILNDLEESGISEGMRILIAGGTLPTTERPEYVAPVVRTTYYYSYLGSTSERTDITILGYYWNLGTPYANGQCTSWAWYKMNQIGKTLPSTLGNANTWASRAAAAGWTVSRTPVAGSVFQTSSGWYGHVGYVESVNGDGSITVTEMNYSYVSGRVTRSTIPASAANNFYYIY